MYNYFLFWSVLIVGTAILLGIWYTIVKVRESRRQSKWVKQISDQIKRYSRPSWAERPVPSLQDLDFDRNHLKVVTGDVIKDDHQFFPEKELFPLGDDHPYFSEDSDAEKD